MTGVNWTLLSSTSSFTIPTGESRIGRQDDCAVCLSTDQSVSRLHAILLASEVLYIRDNNSKFGTYLNGTKLLGNANYIVHDCDVLKFGALASEFRVKLESHPTYSNRYDLAKALISNHPVFADGLEFQSKRFDRQTLFSGLSISSNINELVELCGGIVDSKGEWWTDEEILDAIIEGKLKRRAQQVTVVQVNMDIVRVPSSTLVSSTPSSPATKKINFKTFKKTQPMSCVPELICPSDMSVHKPFESSRHEEWLFQHQTYPRVQPNPSESDMQQNTHQNMYTAEKQTNNTYDRTREDTSEEYTPKKKQKSTQEFESDFFKSVIN